MKTLLALCLVTTLGLSTAQSAQQKGSPEAAKIAREGSQAARDQDWDKAIERFRKAAEMDRKYTQNLAIAYQQRAFSYANDQRFQDALNDLSEAIKINPRDAGAYEQRAAIETRINDYDKALADYGEAIKTNPGEIRYHLYRGYIASSDCKRSNQRRRRRRHQMLLRLRRRRRKTRKTGYAAVQDLLPF